MNRLVLLLAAVTLSCGGSNGTIGGEVPDGGSGGADGGLGGGAGGGAGQGGGTGGGGGGYSPDSFFTQCTGAATTITGTVFAPNGLDPVSAAEVAVWDSAPPALPRGVLCETCDQTVSPAPLASAIAGTDGKFTLNIDTLPKKATYVVTVRKARFRKVSAALTISACGQTTLSSSDTRLPASSAQGDLPKIAISSGNRDHLEKVVTSMGITEFDCVKGLPAGSGSETCTSTMTLGALLADLNAMKNYGLIFIACAPANTFEPTSSSHIAAQNLKAWVALGGKLVVTDASYDFVEQAFPDAVDFMGTPAAAGTAQPQNTAEIGTATTSLMGTVTDASLAAWLRLFPSAINASNGVSITGFLSKWAVQRAVGTNTRSVVHGVASYTGGSGDVPLTTQFEVNRCGRVIYSSYHTESSSSPGLIPQERILEYLLFEVGACTGIN